MHNTKSPIRPQYKEPSSSVVECLTGDQAQGSHGQGKVSEKWKKFKVREKSGNFELSQGNLKFWEKSGKSQGILEQFVIFLNVDNYWSIKAAYSVTMNIFRKKKISF